MSPDFCDVLLGMVQLAASPGALRQRSGVKIPSPEAAPCLASLQGPASSGMGLRRVGRFVPDATAVSLNSSAQSHFSLYHRRICFSVKQV